MGQTVQVLVDTPFNVRNVSGEHVYAAGRAVAGGTSMVQGVLLTQCSHVCVEQLLLSGIVNRSLH